MFRDDEKNKNNFVINYEDHQKDNNRKNLMLYNYKYNNSDLEDENIWSPTPFKKDLSESKSNTIQCLDFPDLNIVVRNL